MKRARAEHGKNILLHHQYLPAKMLESHAIYRAAATLRTHLLGLALLLKIRFYTLGALVDF